MYIFPGSHKGAVFLARRAPPGLGLLQPGRQARSGVVVEAAGLLEAS
jgi:hypothetical protein